jgi:uncharacterized membrane protein
MKKTLQHYIQLTTLNLFVLPVTIYLIVMHYKPEVSEFCTFGETFNCDIVNKSIYAEIFGIPVSILGTLTYLLLLAFSIRGKFKDQSKLVPYVTAFVAFGVLFSLRLTYIEAFVLRTWCLLCVIQQIIILLQLGVMMSLWKLTKKS